MNEAIEILDLTKAEIDQLNKFIEEGKKHRDEPVPHAKRQAPVIEQEKQHAKEEAKEKKEQKEKPPEKQKMIEAKKLMEDMFPKAHAKPAPAAKPAQGAAAEPKKPGK